MLYQTKVKSPQTVGKFRIDPKGGEITEQQFREFSRDAYGKDLIEKGFFIVPGKTPAVESSDQLELDGAGSTGSTNINRE